MIYDSPEQKQFILETVKNFPCNYGQALQLANTFGQSIQDGQVIDIKDQHGAFPPATQMAPVPMPTEAKQAPVNGNRKARRAASKKAAPPKAKVN